MIKNGPKVLLAAVCLGILVSVIYFAVRSWEKDIPNTPIHKPLTVDLNTADAKELANIPGVGSALAKAIISYRESYGSYVDTDELLEIQGMSQELYEEIKRYVTIGGS